MSLEKWTEKEDALIIELKKHGTSIIEIASTVGRTVDATRNRLYLLRKSKEYAKETLKQSWYEGARIGFFDLETSSFDADTGMLLTYCLGVGDEVYSGVIKRSEILSGKDDKRLVEELIKVIDEKVDILVGYYSSRFDIPFLRSRALAHNLSFFKSKEKYHWDLYYLIKFKLKLHRNTLDSATHFFDIEGKNHVDLKIWNKAKLGDKQSLDYVLDHNLRDIEILKDLFYKVKDYKNWTKASI